MDNKKNVLIADLEPKFVELIAEGCEQLGLNAIKAHTGLEAMKVLSDELPDLICIDAKMLASPKMTVCDLIARDPDVAAVPAIVLTGARVPRRKLNAYYVAKSENTWKRLRPVVEELVAVEHKTACR